MFLGGKVKVEGAAGDSGSLDDRVDIRRMCAGTLELHDGGIEHPRARLAALCFAAGRNVLHAPYSAASGRSLTDIT